MIESAGEVAGLLFSGDINSNTEVMVTTYLNGTQQDTGIATNTQSRNGLIFFGLKSTKNFDQVKLTLNLVNDGGSIKLYEICVK